MICKYNQKKKTKAEILKDAIKDYAKSFDEIMKNHPASYQRGQMLARILCELERIAREV